MEKQTKEMKKENILSKPWMQSIIGIVVCIILLISVLTYKILSSRIAIDLGVISAPIITISPEQSGILDSVYVHEGDTVTAGQALAHIGGETLYAKIPGIVLTVENTPGQIFTANQFGLSQAVITMIDPKELRVVGTIDENKGLADIKVGDTATFTVDAFGGTVFNGIVEGISATSKESGATFSISDKREVKQFTIKVRYDTTQYTQFKNGMSAKIKVYTK